MELKTAKDLTKNKDIRAFTAFVSEEIQKLNRLDDIEIKDPVLVSIEIQARQLAFSKIQEILKPFLDIDERSVNFNNTDYVV